MLQMNLVSDARKTAHANVAIRKYVIMNRNKYIYNFWKTVFCFAYSAMQLHMEILAMIICKILSQHLKNKEITLHLTRKKKNMFRKKATGCWVKEDRTSAYFLCFKISDTFK